MFSNIAATESAFHKQTINIKELTAILWESLKKKCSYTFSILNKCIEQKQSYF